MHKIVKILLLMLLSGFLGSGLIAQETRYLNKLDTVPASPTAKIIFIEIETAISEGNVSAIARFFSPQTYFSLSNGTSGYYSSNQAFYVLEDFFKIYRVASFRFNRIRTDELNPYATGIYNFELKGKKDSAQVYISLKKVGTNWKIIQITIN